MTNGFAKLLVLTALAGLSLPPAFSADAGSKTTGVPVEYKECQVTCVDAHPCCEESGRVIEILKKLITAYSSGDLKTYETYLDDSCTMFNENTHKLIAGKTDILKELKVHFAEHAPGGPKPLKALIIDQPFAKMTDENTCVVTFVSTKEIGGQNPHKERANITDVFVKRGDQWKKAHWRGRWETVTDK
jgi:hypothetical protein